MLVARGGSGKWSPADGHYGGLGKGFPDAGRWIENRFPADAHDAGCWAVAWQKGFQQRLMMLAAGRCNGGKGIQLMLIMLAALRRIGKWFSS